MQKLADSQEHIQSNLALGLDERPRSVIPVPSEGKCFRVRLLQMSQERGPVFWQFLDDRSGGFNQVARIDYQNACITGKTAL